jgi:uncharacterized membrane protein
MRYKRALSAALLLGVGLGGFLDGILLHQILHWHQMLSGVLPPDSPEAMRRNMAADGWFHLATWLITLAGVLALWNAERHAGRFPPMRALAGQMLLGWGGFNLVEGILNHHLLGLHHVRDLPAHVPLYDWAFLLVGGVGFILLGLALRGQRAAEPAWLTGERRSGGERRAALL